jgi:hypothetical protein
MINVNQITSQLARMPDPALQKYAQMHKDDPYVMALAMSEFNRRKQMRQGAQANAPEQPKVVDQAIQSMAAPMPEDVGIGQLPAGNMNFAEGGIVAFGDGGEVERYQSGGQLGSAFSTFLKSTGQASAYANGTPAQKAAIEAAFRTAVQGPFVPPAGAAPGAAPAAAAPAGAAPAASKLPLGRLAAGAGAAGVATIPFGIAQGLVSAMDSTREMGMPVDPMGEFGTGAMTPEQAAFDESRRQNILRRQAAKRAEESRLQAAAEGRPTPATAALASPDADFPPAARTRAASNAGADGLRQNRSLGGGPPAAGGPELLGGPGAGAAGAGITPGQGLTLATTPTTLRQEYEAFSPQGPVVDPFAAQTAELGKAGVDAATAAKALREKQLSEMGLFGVEQERRLKARETKLGKQESDLGPLALLQAGFAMMAGASPHAMQNIGIGAQVGLKNYTEGLDKLTTAREKLDDAFGRLEATRRSEKMLTDKERAELDASVKRAEIDARRLTLDGAKQAYGWDRDKTKELFKAYTDNMRTNAEIQSRERMGLAQIEGQKAAARTAAGAQRNLFEALGSAAPDSPLRKGYELSKQEGQVPRLYGEYTKLVADPINGPAFEQKYPTFEAFIAAMGGGRAPGFVTPPKNAPVLRAPGS